MDELKQQGFIFGTIFTVSNKLQILGDEFYKDITTKQLLFMIGVSKFKKPPMISEVANYIGYSRQNAKRIASDLQKKGFVTISKDIYDARVLRIGLTSECKEYFKELDKQEIEFIQKIFSGFDSELTNSMYKGLVKLEANLKELMIDENTNIGSDRNET